MSKNGYDFYLFPHTPQKDSNKNKQRQFHRYPYQRGRGKSFKNTQAYGYRV